MMGSFNSPYTNWQNNSWNRMGGSGEFYFSKNGKDCPSKKKENTKIRSITWNLKILHQRTQWGVSKEIIKLMCWIFIKYMEDNEKLARESDIKWYWWYQIRQLGDKVDGGGARLGSSSNGSVTLNKLSSLAVTQFLYL